MNDLTFYGDSWEHYTYWQAQDKKTLKKINELLTDIQRNGTMKGKGKPERLKYRPGYSRWKIRQVMSLATFYSMY